MGRTWVHLLFVLLLMGATSTQADTTIFEDNFNGENSGSGVLNYGGFANWDVTGGTIDLIGNGFFDFQPGNGLYIDTDGSTGNAGKMTTKSEFLLDPGTYKLSFDLAGSHRGGTDSVAAMIETGIWSEIYSLPGNQAFTTYTKTFSLASQTPIRLSFEGSGGDSVGMLLDNVALTTTDSSPVPAPGAFLLASLGAGAVGYMRRRRTL